MNSEENQKLNPTEEKILTILADFANSIEIASINIKRQISEIVGVNEVSKWEPDKIKWEPAQGASGPYERSDDVNSLDFKTLLKDLASHQGKLTRESYFYWTFQNGATIGRKKQQKQQA
jgi:hypothetical protein